MVCCFKQHSPLNGKQISGIALSNHFPTESAIKIPAAFFGALAPTEGRGKHPLDCKFPCHTHAMSKKAIHLFVNLQTQG